eukprot:4590818-Amphidinium_carterae.1
MSTSARNTRCTAPDATPDLPLPHPGSSAAGAPAAASGSRSDAPLVVAHLLLPRVLLHGGAKRHHCASCARVEDAA